MNRLQPPSFAQSAQRAIRVGNISAAPASGLLRLRRHLRVALLALLPSVFLAPAPALGQNALLCGTKYHDLNQNGARDSGEPGIANWQITVIDQSCSVGRSAITDANGDYCISVCPGVIIVSEQQRDGWIQTAPTAGSYTQSPAPGQIIAGLDFGNFCTTPCPPANLSLNISTGVTDSGASLAPHQADTSPWLVIQDPLATTVEPHFPVAVTPDPVWASMPGSKWVSTTYLAGSDTAPLGLYIYQACFCLDPRFQNPHLTLALLTDNQCNVFLNDYFVGSTPQNSLYGPPTVLDVTDFFQFRIGQNCIRIEVTNTSGPTALNVAGVVTATDGACCADDAECVMTCPDCAMPATEPDCGPNYIDNTNAGCSRVPAQFTPIPCGRTICGTAGAFTLSGAAARDEDWYVVSLEQTCSLTWRVTAEFPVEIEIRSTTSGCPGVVVASSDSGPCGEAIARAEALPGGSYWLVVRPQTFTGVVCGARYLANVMCCRDCDDEPARFEAGNLVLPDDYDPAQPVTQEQGEIDAGYVDQLYSQFDTSTDVWYPCYPCNPSVGGDPPPTPDLDQELANEGFVGVTAEQIVDQLESWEQQLADLAAAEPDQLLTAPPVSGPYTPPVQPYCTRPGCHYVFGGRDIVFVHGLQLKPVLDKLTVPGSDAAIDWQPPTVFPGYIQNPAFYDMRPYGGTLGYWKNDATTNWENHIQKFLWQKGIMNRYLVVTFPATDRVDVCVQTVLTQISDAMRFGVGVVDPAILPNLPTNTVINNFGTPSFVIVSHSTGGLVTAAALSAAAHNANLNAGYIAQYCKAHIAMHPALGGSRLATAALAFVGLIDGAIVGNPNWTCQLIEKTLFAVDSATATHNCFWLGRNTAAVFRSNLFDLVPTVANLKWKPYTSTCPVPTLNIVGGHPSLLYPLKALLHPGFDDGVLTLDCQVGSPNFPLFAPNLYHPSNKTIKLGPVVLPVAPGIVRVFDMGVWRLTPVRATYLFVDQALDRNVSGRLGRALFPTDVASGATPFVSPTGMVQPYDPAHVRSSILPQFPGFLNALAVQQTDPLRRLNANYFSYLQAPSTHFEPTQNFGVSYPFEHYPNYRPTFSAANWEETRVLTDPAVYAPYAMPYYPLDSQPLLTPGCTPRLKEHIRYDRFRIKRRFGRPDKFVYIWKRTYHWLEGADVEHECSYMYDTILCDPVNPCPGAFEDCDQNGKNDECDVVFHDCNDNHVPDACDILTGVLHDRNHNGVPDECEIVAGDLNCDATIDFFDIDPFLLALFDPTSYDTAYADCFVEAADVNGDGMVDFFDIDAFLNVLFGR